MVKGLVLCDSARCRIGYIQESVARQVTDVGVRVAQQLDEHAQPAELAGLNADHRYGVGHGVCMSFRRVWAELECGGQTLAGQADKES